MKKALGVEDLASRLSEAANASIMPTTTTPVVTREQPAKAKKSSSVSVFLRVSAERHAALEAESIARTKISGRHVTVQQIILEKLEKSA